MYYVKGEMSQHLLHRRRGYLYNVGECMVNIRLFALGVKEKSGVVPSAKAVKDTVVVSSSFVEKHVDATVNPEDVNVGMTPTSPNVNPKPAGKKVNSSGALFTLAGNGITGLKIENPNVNLLKEDVSNVSVWVKLHGVYVTAFSEDGLSAIATKLDLLERGFLPSTVRVEYEWKPPRCTCCKVFGHIQEECPKYPGLGVTKNLKEPSQALRGVPVGLKVGFKPAKEYRPVSKKPTTNTSSNKKKGIEPSKEVSNLNPFDVLNSVENDVVKLEKLIIDAKVTLMDDDGIHMKKVDYLGYHDSEDEVKSVDNEWLVLWIQKGLVLALKVCWNNRGILMRMVTIMKTHTMMICMKVMIFLKNSKYMR
nr:hypothetical protein [Tanacetum cinerariifolium]